MLLALARADYYVKKVDSLATIYTLEVCLKGDESSAQYEVEGGNLKVCGYESTSCSGEKNCIDMAVGGEETANLPDSVAYQIIGAEENCGDYEDTPMAVVYLSGCYGNDLTGYIKYAVKDGELVMQYHESDKCDAVKSTTTVGKCDSCESYSNTKLICEQYNAGSLKSILFFIAVLFFLF